MLQKEKRIILFSLLLTFKYYKLRHHLPYGTSNPWIYLQPCAKGRRTSPSSSHNHICFDLGISSGQCYVKLERDRQTQRETERKMTCITLACGTSPVSNVTSGISAELVFVATTRKGCNGEDGSLDASET